MSVTVELLGGSLDGTKIVNPMTKKLKLANVSYTLCIKDEKHVFICDTLKKMVETYRI